MKKLVMLFSMVAAVAATSCEKDDSSNESKFAILTFEDADFKGGDKAYFSSLIDEKESDGSLIYSSTDQYTWTDTDNTFLNGVVNEGTDYYTGDVEWKFWSGGIVISDYYHPVVSGTEVTYMNQLSLSNGKEGAAGHNGSKNFAVANDGSAGGMGAPASLTFADDKARSIDHLYISSTSYLESVAMDGNSDSAALSDGDTYTVTATGFDAEGNETGSVVYNFVNKGALVKGWNKWVLRDLGDVVKVEFCTASNVINSYGTMSLPTNFAIDDIAVVK